MKISPGQTTAVCLATALCVSVGDAKTVQLPPPPPAEIAKITAACRRPAAKTISLARSDVPPPSAPSELNIGWAVQVTPTAGKTIGRVVGVTRTWNGTILAVTDKGFWIRVPSKKDEAHVPRDAPVATTIDGLLGPPRSIAFAGWSGEPGYVGGRVLIAADGASTLLRYQPFGCFPGARPKEDARTPASTTVFRLEPTASD